jgi:hypothetical protein
MLTEVIRYCGLPGRRSTSASSRSSTCLGAAQYPRRDHGRPRKFADSNDDRTAISIDPDRVVIDVAMSSGDRLGVKR